MSSPVHTAVLDPAAPRPDADPARRWRFGAVTGIAAAAPLLFTLSNVFLPVLHGSNASVVAQIPAVAGRLLAVKLVYALASLLLIALAVAVWRADTRRGAVLRLAGGVLLIIGAVSNALGEVVDGYLAWGMHQAAVPAAGQVRLFDLLDNSSAALPVSFLAIPVLSLGLLVAMTGLLMARVLPWWLPAAVIAGGVAAGFTGSGAAALVGLVWSLGAAAIVVLLARRFPARSDAA
ncbi:MAG TPA: hypothetical protein VGD91_23500 [Trebonia sp.]